MPDEKERRRLLRELGELWDSYPELRFGQLVKNLSRQENAPTGFADIWEWDIETWRSRMRRAWREWWK